MLLSDSPVATFILLGSDPNIASQLVVRIVERETGKVLAEKNWQSADADVRFDAVVYHQALDYARDQGAGQVVMSDKISGCPHTEGVDYPSGHPCPYCPAWQETPKLPHRAS